VLETAPPPAKDSDLPTMLAEKARNSSDARLAADATGGFIVAVVSLLVPFPFWYLALAVGGCFLGFGAWGIADRELRERAAGASRGLVRTLRIVKVLATIVGAVSAAVLAIMILGVAIGRVIS
jgi:hypothetical protein